MTKQQDKYQRAILPIPDRPHTGLTTYDAKDPNTEFPPIEPVQPQRALRTFTRPGRRLLPSATCRAASSPARSIGSNSRSVKTTTATWSIRRTTSRC